MVSFGSDLKDHLVPTPCHEQGNQAREGRDTGGTKPNLLFGWVSFSCQDEVLVEECFVQHKKLTDILLHWLYDSCNHS